MKIVDSDFKGYLDRVSFKDHGDLMEREFGDLLSTHFPNCEQFWKLFVVPLTIRIEGYPDMVITDINIRQSIGEELQNISSAHYSLFINLIFAHLHLQQNNLYSLEDIYVHLGAACDLVETVLTKWFILMKACREESVNLLQNLSREDFLRLAGEWYDKNYERLYSNYKVKGNPPPLKLPSRRDLITEYFGKNSDDRQKYIEVSRPIREFRNVIVHDIRIARIIIDGEKFLIPRSSRIQDYRNWRKVAEVHRDRIKIEQDFQEEKLQCEQDLIALEDSINRLWDKLIKDYLEELYNPERGVFTRIV